MQARQLAPPRLDTRSGPLPWALYALAGVTVLKFLATVAALVQ